MTPATTVGYPPAGRGCTNTKLPVATRHCLAMTGNSSSNNRVDILLDSQRRPDTLLIAIKDFLGLWLNGFEKSEEVVFNR